LGSVKSSVWVIRYCYYSFFELPWVQVIALKTQKIFKLLKKKYIKSQSKFQFVAAAKFGRKN